MNMAMASKCSCSGVIVTVCIRKRVQRDKKLVAQKIVVEYLCFQGGDFPPLPNYNTVVHTNI